MAITEKKHTTFVLRINGVSIYWKDRYARRDAYYFVLIYNGKQNNRAQSLYGAISSALGNKKATALQKKKFLRVAKKFDEESIPHIKKYL